MNSGGEPERDDTGLPPVDIEIPDDARELDRDVQAYYRELRAGRRRDRRRRWHRFPRRDGLALPVLACCLILALISGTLLTVFSATSGQTARLGAGSAASQARPGSAAATMPRLQLVGPLPRANLYAGREAPIEVDRLTRAMLMVVPADCACGPTLTWLAGLARQADARAYLVYTPQTSAQISQIYARLAPGIRISLTQAEDLGNVLTSQFPPGFSHGQLTAILVSPTGEAAYADRLGPADNPAAVLRWMTG